MYRQKSTREASDGGGFPNLSLGTNEKTAAQIISEAKASITRPLNGRKLLDEIYGDGRPGTSSGRNKVDSMKAGKLVVTERPFTPKPRERHLYPARGGMAGRPQSGSINLQLIEEESGGSSRPMSSAGVRLAPLMQKRPSDVSNARQAKISEHEQAMQQPPPRSLSLENGQLFMEAQAARQQQTSTTTPQAFPELGGCPPPSQQGFKRSSSLGGGASSTSNSQLSSLSSQSEVPSGRPSSSSSTKLRHQFRKMSTEDSRANSAGRSRAPVGPSKDDPIAPPPQSSEHSYSVNSFEMLLDHLKGAQDDIQVAKYLETMVALLGNSGLAIQPYQRKSLLRVIGRHLASENTSIMFPLVDALLLLKVVRSNFAMASKLLFKLAKDDTNDHFFATRRTLELYLTALGRNCPMTDFEAFVYGYGGLKFVTLNTKLLHVLEGVGFIQLATLHLKVLVNQIEADPAKQSAMSKEVSNVMFQITSCLRNMMNSKRSKSSFLDFGGVDLLLDLVEGYAGDVDVMCNVARTLSILSAEDQDCLTLVMSNLSRVDVDGSTGSKSGSRLARRLADAAFTMLSFHASRRDIVVRLTFCLGNLAANCDESRLILANKRETLTLLPQLLKQYIQQLPVSPECDKNGVAGDHHQSLTDQESYKDSDFGSSGTIEDTAVKIIRVFANVSINPEAGTILALNEDIVGTLIDICLHANSATQSETRRPQSPPTILLPTLATLNNLSFYPLVLQVETYRALKAFMHIPEWSQVCAETARVFGNLSRRPEIRQCFLEEGEFSGAVQMLSTVEDRELSYACVGIMVNMMSDPTQRPTFKRHGGLEKCVSVLERCLESQDWSLASLTCQALWNFCIDSPDITQCIENEDTLCELEDVIVCLLEACNYTAHQRAAAQQSQENFEEGGEIIGERSGEELTDEVMESLASEEKEFCKVGLGLLKRLLDRDSNREYDLLLPSPQGSDS